MRMQKYLMYFKDEYFLVERKISSKPCKSLYEHAQSRPFLLCPFFVISGLHMFSRIIKLKNHFSSRELIKYFLNFSNGTIWPTPEDIFLIGVWFYTLYNDR